MLVVIEESYKISVWCREIVDGLQKEARKKRVSLTLSASIDDIPKHGEDNAIFIVGAETEWLNIATKHAIACGKHPIILSNQSESTPQHGVSRVSEDIFGSMSEIMNLFSHKGYERIALYACNPDSASDSFKKEAFLRLGGKAENIFINKGSLKDCFDSFFKNHAQNRFTGIVCANDFAAVSLIQHLNNKDESIENLDIISYSNTLISKCVSPAISTVKANFKSFGQLAFMIVDCISKGENISGIRILCNWDIIHRGTSSPIQNEFNFENQYSHSNSGCFYEDSELMEMMRVETLLSSSDKTDLEIIEAILCGKKTAEIEESCFLTETSVKYRIKKMKEICLVNSRAELKALLSNYLPEGNLQILLS